MQSVTAPTRDLEKDEEADQEDTGKVDIDISPEKILVQSSRDTYATGSTMRFTGESMPNTTLEVSLEDSDGREVFADILEIDDSGHVYLEVKTDDSFTHGAYFLILKQGDDSKDFIYLIMPLRN